MTPDPTSEGPSIDVLHQQAGNVVALIDKRVVVFARTQALTLAALEAAELAVRLAASSANQDRPGGALAIVPADAGLSRNELLDRQRQLIAAARTRKHVWVAFCAHGTGPQVTVTRAVIRMFLLGQRNMKMFDTPAEAVRWLAKQVRLEPNAFSKHVDQLRKG